jgi:DNA invertase Pin-like site-specific DNA recombinase
LKAKNPKITIETQQKHIFRFANQNSFELDSTEIDNSNLNEKLEGRVEFKAFLRSLNRDNRVFIYDFSTYSIYVDELIKIFDCLFDRDIETYVTSLNLLVHKEMFVGEMFSILSRVSEYREDKIEKRAQGRPKGRVSKSKFDIYRLQIINLLEKKHSVSEIAKILQVSRSSLKDYINSRGLKELVDVKSKLIEKKDFKKIDTPKECSLRRQND